MQEHDEDATFGVSEVAIECPFCWETVTVLVDGSVPDQRYVEDCEVCCRPIEIRFQGDAEGLTAFEAVSIEQ